MPCARKKRPGQRVSPNLQVHKQRGQDKKGQHGGQECEEPQHQPGLCPQKGLPGKEQEQTEKRIKGRKEKARFIKIPRKSWDASLSYYMNQKIRLCPKWEWDLLFVPECVKMNHRKTAGGNRNGSFRKFRAKESFLLF